MESREIHNETVRAKSIAFAIVVYREAYFNTTAFTSLVTSLAEIQDGPAAQIFVYDNTDKTDWNIHAPNTSIHWPVNYHHNPGNPGISVAYNYMASRAIEAGCKWIVFLDQDTSLPVNSVEKYMSAIANQPHVLIKAPVLTVNSQIFSPSRFFLKRTVVLKEIEYGIQSMKKYTMVNSGLLVNLELFFEVQGYDERLKLDFADFVFLDKVREVTDQFEVLDLTCQHEFSNNETDIRKSLNRYAIFIKDLSNCPRKDFADKLGYFLVGILHLLNLSVKFRSLQFLRLHFG